MDSLSSLTKFLLTGGVPLESLPTYPLKLKILLGLADAGLLFKLPFQFIRIVWFPGQIFAAQIVWRSSTSAPSWRKTSSRSPGSGG